MGKQGVEKGAQMTFTQSLVHFLNISENLLVSRKSYRTLLKVY